MLSYLQQFIPWGAPWAAAAFIWATFGVLDSLARSNTKAELATYINTASYSSHFGSLPSLVGSTLNRVYGQRHWSFKCIIRSLLITVASLIAIFSWSYILSPSSDFAPTKTFSQLQPSLKFLIVSGLAFWPIWSILADYLSLFKTRILVAVLEKFELTTVQLASVAFFDLCAGVFLFIMSTAIVLAIAYDVDHLYLGFYHISPSNEFASFYHAPVSYLNTFVLAAIVACFEALILIPEASIFKDIPVADFFWASMVPSMWLWLYIGTALLTRNILKMTPLLAQITRLFDVDAQPFKVLGLVASAISFLVVSAFLIGRAIL